MCRVITPEGGHSHEHVHTNDPLEAAELLRESLAEELHALSDLAARWHMIEEETARDALAHAIGLKRQALQELFCALQELEAGIFDEADYQGCACVSHGHGETTHSHTHR